jgi:large subunit ribosomal protein L36e
VILCGKILGEQSVLIYWRLWEHKRGTQILFQEAAIWSPSELQRRQRGRLTSTGLFSTMSSSGIAVGLNRGFPVTKRVVGARPSNNKARISKRTKMVRDLVSEVVGMSPYERRLLDMLKTGGAGSEKRMYKFAKRRVSRTGTAFLPFLVSYDPILFHS